MPPSLLVLYMLTVVQRKMAQNPAACGLTQPPVDVLHLRECVHYLKNDG